jgi:formate C-acetyltransferase
MFRTGFLDLKSEIKETISKLDYFNDPKAYEKSEELKAMDIACDAIIMYANRYADELSKLSEIESDSLRKGELEKIAAVCRRVPAYAPETVHEMLQHYWFIHLGVITELNPWDSFNPGRLDQHLWSIYKKEKEAGSPTDEMLYDLLGCHCI